MGEPLTASRVASGPWSGSPGRPRLDRVVLVMLAALALPTAAQANAGTPLMWAGFAHLTFGNLLIGLLEAALLIRLFRMDPARRPAVLLVLGNYVSAWVGGLFLRGAIVRSLPMDLSNAWSWQWFMVAVTYLLTLVLEYPFVVMALPRLPGRLRAAAWGSLVIQTASYALLFGWYWMASGKSLYTAMDIVEPTAIALPEGVAVYSIGAADGHVYRMDLPGLDRRRVVDLGSTGRMDRLYVCPSATAEGRWDLMARLEGKDRSRARDVVVVAGVAAEAAPSWQSLLARPPRKEVGTWGYDGPAARLGPAKDSPWKFRAGFWATEGLWGEHTGTGAIVHLAIETPFTAWMVRNATHLPGDAVLFQLGRDQICVLDPVRRQVALLARGRGPTAVMAEAAPPSPPASAAAAEPPRGEPE